MFISEAPKPDDRARLRPQQPPDLGHRLGRESPGLRRGQGRILRVQAHHRGGPRPEGVHGGERQPRRLHGGRGVQRHTLTEFTRTRLVLQKYWVPHMLLDLG